LTRWLFLFGRKRLLKKIDIDKDNKVRILDIGCGTGYSLKYLEKKYPNAELIGVDLSPEMIKKAKKKSNNLNLILDKYSLDLFAEGEFDLIIASYSLTIINNQTESLRAINHHLKIGGTLAIVDFDYTKFSFYDSFMKWSNVFIDKELYINLQSIFINKFNYSGKSMYGLWHYFIFIGQK